MTKIRAVILSEAKDPGISPFTDSGIPQAPEAHIFGDHIELRTTPPQQGIAPDLQARSGLPENLSSFGAAGGPASVLSLEDRGIYHAADAMKDLYDMGDSPSCATCGAIMTRSGSCYRCMSCGSTSGCS